MKHFQEDNLIVSVPIGGFSNDEKSEQMKEYNEYSMLYREEDTNGIEDYEDGIKHFNN